MPEAENTILAIADTWDLDTRMVIGTSEGFIILQVHEKGEQPIVDILETPEGKTTGPLMKFLGSVASKAELYEGKLQIGQIIQSYRLVVEAGNIPFLLSGNIQTVNRKTGKQRKNAE